MKETRLRRFSFVIKVFITEDIKSFFWLVVNFLTQLKTSAKLEVVKKQPTRRVVL